MQVTLTNAGCTLTREAHDKPLSHESTVAYKMKQLLNTLTYGVDSREGYCNRKAFYHRKAKECKNFKPLKEQRHYHFVRFNPSKHGLTACTIGLIDRKANIILWHESYAIESAAFAFNKHKRVFFQRVAAD